MVTGTGGGAAASRASRDELLRSASMTDRRAEPGAESIDAALERADEEARTIVRERESEPERLLAAALDKFRALGIESCSQCRQAGWTATVRGVVAHPFPTNAFQDLPPPMLPLLVLTCEKCGLVSMYSLKAWGLVP